MPIIDLLEHYFGLWVVRPVSAVLFFDLAIWWPSVELPFVVVWLVAGAAYFTIYFRFLNLRAFRHAIDCALGRYTQAEEGGEITHFQALSAALSATVGLGNIAGVAVAVGLGGPGAVVWMIAGGLLGMSSKFVECSLGQMYRIVREDGHVSGGPMHYLADGLRERGWSAAGRVLSVAFCLMCIGGSLGGGNMFQANQSYVQVASVLPVFAGRAGALVFGILLATLVGLVIIGGIRRIGEVAAVIVPFMCALYIACGLWIVASHLEHVPEAAAVLLRDAFTLQAGVGGLVGTMIQGFRRAAFSNEAGIGSASIAHSAASTEEPIREGIVALLEPFIDTVVVCAMTGIVLVVTGAYAHPEAGDGIRMTSWAFATVFPWFPALLSLTAVLFAFSTMISWSYYGEQCWAYLFGTRRILLYKGLFLFFVAFGAVSTLEQVVEFSDLMILGMAVPNIAGLYILRGRVRRALDDYLARLRRGEFRRGPVRLWL